MNQTDTITANRERLKTFIAAENDALLRTLRLYVLRAGLGPGDTATQQATELLNEVTAEALAHADRFRPSGEPMAWLLGIAANLIKRRQVRVAKDERREPLARDLYARREALMSEDELFDLLAQAGAPNPARTVEAQDQVAHMLAHVSGPDQRVIQLAVLHDLNGNELASELGITPGAARVRLHRALNRLREALAETRGTDL